MSLAAALEDLGLEPLLEEPLSRHGYWRIGGPAEALVEVTRPDQLAGVLALGEQCSQPKRRIFSCTLLTCFCSVLSLDSCLPHSGQLTLGIPEHKRLHLDSDI